MKTIGLREKIRSLIGRGRTSKRGGTAEPPRGEGTVEFKFTGVTAAGLPVYLREALLQYRHRGEAQWKTLHNIKITPIRMTPRGRER
jgi:hypothetical protein